VKVCVAGNVQHNPELAPYDITWTRNKSFDQLNTAFRHMWDHGQGTVRDADGQYHLAKAMWRIGAELQLQIEKDRTHEERGQAILAAAQQQQTPELASIWETSMNCKVEKAISAKKPVQHCTECFCREGELHASFCHQTTDASRASV
jgi:hypothetical protein